MASQSQATVHDVAAYIVKQCGPVTAMKLQKLVYYCQAWSLVWDEHPIFPERIEAWTNGPVVPDLYKLHRGQFEVGAWPKGDPTRLDAAGTETVDAVLEYYGHRSPQWLSDLAHSEDPWRLAREGLDPRERGHREITHASMAEYYGGLLPNVQEA